MKRREKEWGKTVRQRLQQRRLKKRKSKGAIERLNKENIKKIDRHSM